MADSFIMCPEGRVRAGDSYETVKSKCGADFYSSKNGIRISSGKKIEYKISKFKFNDGSKVAFIFINKKLLDTIIFD
jgi:hypothetical protein